MYLTSPLHLIICYFFLASYRIPHLLIIYSNGKVADISSEEILSPSENVDLKLPKSRYREPFVYLYSSPWGYYAYSDLQNIYIFDGKGTRDITYIDCLTFKDNRQANTKLPRQVLQGIGVRVGHRFIIAGGVDFHKISGINPDLMSNLHSSGLFWTRKTDSWSIKRKKYIYSLKFRPAIVGMSCLTSFNRSS